MIRESHLRKLPNLNDQWTLDGLDDLIMSDPTELSAGVSAYGTLGQFVALKSENKRLAEENKKMRRAMEDAKLTSFSSFTTVPIPGLGCRI